MPEAPGPSPEDTRAIDVADVPAHEKTAPPEMPRTEVITDVPPHENPPRPEMPAGPVITEVPKPGGDQAAAARAAVDAAAPTEGQYPRGRDALGGNDHWGYNSGDRAQHRADMGQARDRLARLNGLPTDAEKAQMRADVAKKPSLLSRIRGRFGG